MSSRCVLAAALALSFEAQAAPFDDARLDAPPAVDGTVGTAHPLGGYMASADGRQLVLCQARRDTDGNGRIESTYSTHVTGGDALLPYLVLGSGAGMQLDYPAARSARGEWFAVVRQGRLALIETSSCHRFPLENVDLRLDNYYASDEKNVRFISIAANASRMTYLRRDGDKDVIVIRDLPGGAERSVVVKNLLWRVAVDDAGRWARVRVIRKDSDHDGRLAWPGGVGERAFSACGQDTLHHRNVEGDQVTTLWLDLVDLHWVEDPEVVGAVGDELLRRRRDGSLVLGTTPLVDGRCKAQVISTLASPPRVAVTCGGKSPKQSDTEAPVRVLGPGLDLPTHQRAYRAGYDVLYQHPRFLYGSDRRQVVDLALGAEITLPGERAHDHQHLVLVHTDHGYVVFDLITRTSRPLSASGAAESVYKDFLVKIGSELYDLRTAKKLSTDAGEVVLVTDEGRVLLSPKGAPEPGKFPSGPLRWAR